MTIDLTDIIKNGGLFNSMVSCDEKKHFLSHCQRDVLKSSEIYRTNTYAFSIELCVAKKRSKSYEIIMLSQHDNDYNVNIYISDKLGIMSKTLKQLSQLHDSSLPKYSVYSEKGVDQMELHFSNGCKLIYEDEKSVPAILINTLFIDDEKI